MQIIDAHLSFGGLSRRGSTNRIILHHAEASTCTPEDINRWHKANGWSGAGYHFLVRKDGTVYSLRPEWALGAHAARNNFDSLGICFEGSFMRETMGDAQIQAGRELVAYLKAKYGISKVQRHKDVCPTDCPGTNFPFDAIAYGGAAPASVESVPASRPTAQEHTGTGFGGTYTCQVDNLNVRTAPSTSAGVVAQYHRGEKVTLQDWYFIQDGYVWGRYVGGSGNIRYVAVGKPTGGPAADDYLVKGGSGGGYSAGTYRCTGDGVRVRRAPSFSGEVVAKYNRGETVKLDSFVDGDGLTWGSYVGASGHRNYVATKYFERV